MGLSVTTTIFLFVVCLCGGIVIGAMFGRAKKAPPEEKEEKKPPREEPAPKEKSLAQPGDTAVLRAWRNKADQIWLEMNGQRLESIEELGAGQKKDLLSLLFDLRPWIDSTVLPAPNPQVQVPSPQEVPASPQPSPLPPRTPKGAKKPLAADLKPVTNMKSIVEQIDDVLQEKLVGTQFSTLEIHLREGPGGEVNVQIGALTHPGVDAIPNPEIQALIRQAAADWEKSTK